MATSVILPMRVIESVGQLFMHSEDLLGVAEGSVEKLLHAFAQGRAHAISRGNVETAQAAYLYMTAGPGRTACIGHLHELMYSVAMSMPRVGIPPDTSKHIRPQRHAWLRWIAAVSVAIAHDEGSLLTLSNTTTSMFISADRSD